MGEVVKIFGGNAFKSSDSTDSGVRWLKIANVGIDGIDWTTPSYLPNSFWNESESFQLFKGDYVMALTRPILNHDLKIAKMDTNALLNQRVAKLSFTTYSEYGYQLLKKRSTVDLIQNELAGTDPPNLGSKELDNVNVNITNNIEEQKMIGDFFKQFGNTIALHQRKLDVLKKLKQAYLQNMFPSNGESIPKVRFTNFIESWEQRKFSNLVTRVSKSNEEKELPRVEYEDVISGVGKLNKDIFNKKSNKKGIGVEVGDVLFGKLRPYLQNWLLADFKGIAVGDWWVLRPNEMDSNFIYSLIQGSKYQTVANLSTGTKMPRSDWKIVSQTEFLLPINKGEQAEIGTFFAKLDNLITLHQRRLEKLNRLKKSYLQKMFI